MNVYKDIRATGTGKHCDVCGGEIVVDTRKKDSWCINAYHGHCEPVISARVVEEQPK